MARQHLDAGGPPLTLAELGALVAACWSEATCDEHDAAGYDGSRPSLGQCTSTAYVINDLLGGRLLGAEVRYPDGTLQGYHYWNQFHGGLEIDLTLDQFVEGEVVGTPIVMERIHATPTPGAAQYVELRRRVVAALAARRGAARPAPDAAASDSSR